MPVIPYEPGAHYVFDRGYNDFSNLYTINLIGAFFVMRAKSNIRIKPKIWKRRLLEGVVSDVIGHYTVYKSSKDYLEELRKFIVEDSEDGTRYIFLMNNLDASSELISLLYQNRWSVELFFKWIKQGSFDISRDRIVRKKKTAEQLVYLNNHKQIYKNEQ